MKCKIRDLVIFNPESIGNNNDYVTINYLDTANLTKNIVFEIVNLKICEAPSRAKRIIRKGDILYSTVRPNLCHYGIVEKDYKNLICSTGFAVLRVKENVNPYYLYSHLTLSTITEKLHLIAENSTSAYPSIKPDDIGNLEIDIPSIEIQNKIASILQRLENKMNLNNQINDNLYAILKQLYTNLYINNKDYNVWKNTTLDETTSKFATGLNPRKNFVLGEGNNYYVTIKNMHNNRVILDDKCDKVTNEALEKINKRSNLKVGDLLFSGIGTIGRTYLITKEPNNWNISESVFTLRPNEKVTSEFLYLLLLSSDMQNYAVSLASGSVQKGIRMADLKRYTYKLPNEEFMNEFTNEIKPLIQIIDNNNYENDNLTRLRDTLLPKLMNGEIDIDNIKI